MGFIIIIPFAALSGWSIFAVRRWLRRGAFGPEWWKAFKVLVCAGILLGAWFALFLEYTVANRRLEGFPIPIQISQREKPADPWVKSPMPVAVRIGGIVTDFLSGVAICLVPIAIGAFFKENRIQRDAHGRPMLRP